MSDVYIEDPDDEQPRPGTIARTAHRLEDLVHRYASDAVDTARGARDNAVEEARFLTLKARHKINSRLGASAAIALGTGIALGLLAALLSSGRAASRRGTRRADR
jgi:hypothetical protein